MANSKVSAIQELMATMGLSSPSPLNPSAGMSANDMAALQQYKSQSMSQMGAYSNGMSMGSLGLQTSQNDPTLIKRNAEAKQIAVAALANKIAQLSVAVPIKLTGRVPDHYATLLGWRGWKVEGGKLVALGMTGVWEPKKAVRAVCTSRALGTGSVHDAPDKGCKCGYWSFKSQERLHIALEGYANHVQVIGTIEHWGKVVECTNGFRSEYAYPKELWLLEDGLEHLSWEYGVPIRRIEL